MLQYSSRRWRHAALRPAIGWWTHQAVTEKDAVFAALLLQVSIGSIKQQGRTQINPTFGQQEQLSHHSRTGAYEIGFLHGDELYRERKPPSFLGQRGLRTDIRQNDPSGCPKPNERCNR